MEVLKFNHCLESYLQNGIRLEDKVTLSPAFGRRRTFALNRTIYQISLKKSHSPKVGAIEISLCALNEREGEFSLELVEFGGEQYRYRMRALSKLPFRLNGVFSFDALIEKGDRVEIGHNKFDFCRDENQQCDLIPEPIIQSSLSIMIQGETGIGKTRLAKMIHEKSGRNGEFVHLNLAGLSQGLIESELFGHEKGAFTGALTEKVGAFQFANYGTIFLDEIDSIPLNIQVKLLLFLDDMIIKKVGGLNTKKVDIRFIFASGRSLEGLLEKEIIRKDFYFRLTSGHVLRLAPLRERPRDIEKVVNEFLQIHSMSISCQLLDFYTNFSWPGNYRQLIGHLERKITFKNKGRLEFDEQDEGLSSNGVNLASSSEVLTLEEVKRNYVKSVYYKNRKNINVTAKMLNISLNTIRKMLRT